jgi:hypothetical protein
MTPEQIITHYLKSAGVSKEREQALSPPLVIRPFSGLYKINLDFLKNHMIPQ